MNYEQTSPFGQSSTVIDRAYELRLANDSGRQMAKCGTGQMCHERTFADYGRRRVETPVSDWVVFGSTPIGARYPEPG